MKHDGELDPERWVDRHGDALYRFALLRLRAPELAGDAVQETFAKALRARESFARGSSERTWLFGILKHVVADVYRSRVRSESRLDESPEHFDEDFFDHRGRWKRKPRAWSLDPARDLESGEFREILRRCLEDLPEEHAQAFIMREVDEISAEEIRKLLGISPTNLWTRLHRARLALRRCLEARWFRDRS